MSIVDILLVLGIEVDTEEEDGQQTQSVDEDYDVLECTVDHITQPRIRLTSKQSRQEVFLYNLAGKLQGEYKQSRGKELHKFSETQIQELELHQKLLSLLSNMIKLLLHLLE